VRFSQWPSEGSRKAGASLHGHGRKAAKPEMRSADSDLKRVYTDPRSRRRRAAGALYRASAWPTTGRPLDHMQDRMEP
jgi:hypothetical protein